ncbi:MAG: hypothetical protein AB1403_16255 [Candidatus Riflebacteria bacterium]
MKKTWLILVLFFCATAGFADEPTHLLVSGANVRIRSDGNTGAKVVATLPIGTWAEILEVGTQKQSLVGKDDFWYKIRDENSNEGWIFGGLAEKCSAEQRFSAAASLAMSRLEQFGRPIEEAEQLYNFCQKLVKLAANPDDQAYSKLAELQSLQLILNTLSAMGKGSDDSHPVLKSRKDLIYYHECAGQYFISPDIFWDLAKLYPGSEVGDLISWEAAKQQLPGETEGDPTALLVVLSLSEAEYLKGYPSGRFVENAVETIRVSMESMPNSLINYFEGEAASGRGPFIEQLGELEAIIKSCNSKNRLKLLDLIEQVKKAAEN